MRIRTMAALGFATAAVATGLAIGGAAYADGGAGSSPAVYQIVQDEQGAQTTREDCPEKGGAGTDAPESGGAESGGPATGGTAPQESL